MTRRCTAATHGSRQGTRLTAGKRPPCWQQPGPTRAAPCWPCVSWAEAAVLQCLRTHLPVCTQVSPGAHVGLMFACLVGTMCLLHRVEHVVAGLRCGRQIHGRISKLPG